MKKTDVLVLAFEDYLTPARHLADILGCECRQITLHQFPDGESRVTLPVPIPPTVILVRTLNNPNARLLELLISAETARAKGARHVALVAPYLCYMRQDIEFHPGEAVSQKIIGKLLADHFDAVITVDPHLHRIERLDQAITNGMAIALSAAPLMGEMMLSQSERPLLVGPDEESLQWVRKVAAPAGLDYVIASKVRHGDRNVEITLPEADYAGRNALLVDDVISSGHTLMRCAQLLREKGCKSVAALCTHALLAPGAKNALQAAGIDPLISTDSILHASNRIALAPLLAAAVNRFVDSLPSGAGNPA